jgi:hypothetical protein
MECILFANEPWDYRVMVDKIYTKNKIDTKNKK